MSNITARAERGGIGRYKGFAGFTATMPGLPATLKNKIELCITAVPANPS